MLGWQAAVSSERESRINVIDWEKDNGSEVVMSAERWNASACAASSYVMAGAAKSPSMLVWRSMGDFMDVGKAFQMRKYRWSAGFVRLVGRATKPPQTTKGNFVLFYVVRGKVIARVHDSEFVVDTGMMFFVPPRALLHVVGRRFFASLTRLTLAVPQRTRIRWRMCGALAQCSPSIRLSSSTAVLVVCGEVNALYFSR